MIGVTGRLQSNIRREWPGAVLFLLALGLRIYRLPSQLLWLDEIYALQLIGEGPLAILKNSQLDPHPPFYYFLQWLASGFGAIQSEWGLRWLSMLCGALTIPLFYLLCRRFTGRIASAATAFALAVSPFHIYYSQEGRPYAFLTLLATWTTLIAAQILEDPKPLRRWISLALLSLVGVFSQYLYIIIIGVQVLILLLRVRGRGWWVYASVMGIGIAIAGWMMAPTLSDSAQKNYSVFLTPLIAIQSLAGEPARFYVTWQHWWLISIIGGLALTGLLLIVPRVKKSALEFYLVMQILLAGVIVFGLLPPLGVRFPFFQSRQLLILLPALFGLAAVGIDWIARRLGWLVPALLCGGILAASAAGIQAYWQLTKSPEGTLVQSLRPEVQSGDILVSLHYSMSAGLYAYLPESGAWVFTGEDSRGLHFSQDVRQYQIAVLNPRPAAETTVEELRRQPRFWVLNRTGSYPTVYDALTAGCSQVQQVAFPPFEATLWSGCQP